MNLFRVSLAGVRSRPLETSLNVILLGLGVGTIVLLLLIGAQLERKMQRDAAGIDLVVGAKGSPLQLILSSIYHLDIPTGNIPLKEASRLMRHPMVKKALPLSLGDSFRDFRIVGCTPTYLEHYGAAPIAGQLWTQPLEAVLGAEVARSTGLAVGATFSGSHGLEAGGEEHHADPYRVVGVLGPTGSVLDRLILTDLASVWAVHEHSNEAAGEEEAHEAAAAASDSAGLANREVTALLLQYRTPLAAAQLPRTINRESVMQAASPAFELARLLNLIGVGLDVVRAFGLVFILIAALSMFVGLYNALESRRFDLAILRTLGATRGQVFRTILAEGLIVAGLGTALGLLLGHGAAEAIGFWLKSRNQVNVTGWIWLPVELALLALALMVGFLSALVPALRAYRADIASTLARAN